MQRPLPIFASTATRRRRRGWGRRRRRWIAFGAPRVVSGLAAAALLALVALERIAG